MKTSTPAEHARQVLRMKVFAEASKSDPNTQRDTGQFFINTCTHLDNLLEEHADVLGSYEFSRFMLVLRSNGMSLPRKLARLSFDLDKYLSELNTWLNTEQDALLLTDEDLSVFLQIARTGRRTFQANGHDPERFLTDDKYWLATVLLMALVGFHCREPA